MLELSNFLKNGMDELSRLVERYPSSVPVLAMADFLRVKPDALRASIDQGRCPFGFCWSLGKRKAYRIPTVTFCQWYLGHPL